MKAAPRQPRGPGRGTRDSLPRIMPSQTAAHLTLSDFALTLSTLLIATTVSCAGKVTPPDTTPVYAEEVAEGVERVEVEHHSTNRPEPENVTALKNTTAAPEQESEMKPAPEKSSSAKSESPSSTEVSPDQEP